MKDYQNIDVDAAIPVPATVDVAMEDVAATMREGHIGSGGRGRVAGDAGADGQVGDCAVRPEGKHRPDRTAVRHGSEDRWVTLGGRRVPVRPPRVRAVDGAGEVAVPAYELFSSTEVLAEMALARMLARLSTRRYRVGLEPVGTAVEAAASATSKSAVSRKFVAATERALDELMTRDVSRLEPVAVMPAECTSPSM